MLDNAKAVKAPETASAGLLFGLGFRLVARAAGMRV